MCELMVYVVTRVGECIVTYDPVTYDMFDKPVHYNAYDLAESIGLVR